MLHPPLHHFTLRRPRSLARRLLSSTAVNRSPPPPATPLDLSQPLDLSPKTLALYRARLAAHVASTACPSWRYKGPQNTTWRHAAVCIPLVSLPTPSILLTVRSAALRRHAGQVSLPGGSQDPSDQTLVDAALRETEEEVGIPRESVHVLGTFHPLPDRTQTILIHPVLCHVPSLRSLDELRCAEEEVAEAFVVPLATLLADPDQQPENLVRGGPRHVRNWTVEGHKIWGLTAWVLEGLLTEVIAPAGVVGVDEWRAENKRSAP
ncbi:hypothetical protein HDU88_005854 [Geranomyces variabilis]|nr:hypothetical protein HDU88_005854 [Geranomyces variabilis]